MALAVTPVSSELSLMAAAVAMALAALELVADVKLDNVSSSGLAARMATPLIFKSLIPNVLMSPTVLASGRSLVLTVDKSLLS